jgi:hypothetical protein
MGIASDHPMFNPSSFYLHTPMAEALSDFVLTTMWCGHPGGYVLGLPRQGKSTACLGLTRTLETRAGERVMVHRVVVSPRDRMTIAGILKNICFALNLSPSQRATADDMVSTIVYFLTDSACINSARHVVLLVDEFQRLSKDQLACFSELYDKLHIMNVNLKVFFIGNHSESMELLNSLDKAHFQHIKQRFFMHEHRFWGIRTFDELAACMQFYDEPYGLENEHEAMSKSAAPKDFEEGWRFKDLATSVWAVYNENYAHPLGLKSLGMQYFVAVMATLLADFIPRYGVCGELDGCVSNAFEISGIGSSQVFLA